MTARPASKVVSDWQYETIAKILNEGLVIPFTRRTAVLKGTEAYGGHNHGIPHLGEKDDYIAQVEA